MQATIECGFTLKRVRDMTRTYSQLLILLTFLESLKIFLINMVIILLMSPDIATLGLLKTTTF